MSTKLRYACLLLAIPLLVGCASNAKVDTTTATTPAASASDVPSVVVETTASGATEQAQQTAIVPAAVKLTPVTLVLDWTPNTNHSGFYVAKENGYYKDAGLDVTIVEPGADGGLPQLEAGNAQFVVTVAESLLPARAAGAKAVSVATIIQHNTSSLIMPKDRNINRPKDLEGHTYGGFGGPLEKALVDKIVSCDGGDPSKVKYVEIGNVDYKIGLQRKDYDAVWVFDGWDSLRLSALDGIPLTSFPFFSTAGPTAGCIPDWYTPLLATSEKLIAEKPDLVQSFVQATAQGYELARTNAATASAALLKAAPELDHPLVIASAEYLASRYADQGTKWGVQDSKVWADFESFLSAQKILTTPVDTTKAFTNEFLPK